MKLMDATVRAAVMKLLMEKLKAADSENRVAGLKLFKAANNEIGLRSTEVKLPTGERVGTATLPEPQPKPAIDDEAFLRFVETEHPDEIVRSVNPAFRTLYEKRLKIVDGEVVDLHTGESVPWATAAAAPEPKSFSIVFTKEGRDVVEQAWRDDPTILLELLVPGSAATLRGSAAPEIEAAADDDLDLADLLRRRAEGGGAA